MQNTIADYFEYNPETGVIIWIKSTSRKIKIGQIAGTVNNTGYLRISYQGKLYQAHRLAWYLHYGAWPTNNIDHINGVKTDNRINNLRDATQSTNTLNKKGHRENTYKYYSFNKEKQKWVVQASINGKLTYFGRFKTKELARQFIQHNIELFRRTLI